MVHKARAVTRFFSGLRMRLVKKRSAGSCIHWLLKICMDTCVNDPEGAFLKGIVDEHVNNLCESELQAAIDNLNPTRIEEALGNL